MAELEIDQSHLPQVQKVCQCFAVLEDGALAHNLQEQEIEQYYNSNVQKNQLVQKDIRVARSLQDEEERAALLRQATQQQEEQDLEYARAIQEEIRRCAEEAQRREEEDEEMAKRIQREEEEMDVRRKRREGGCRESSCQGNVSSFPLGEGACLEQGEACLEQGEACLEQGEACLELGALQQVLLDEELARRLQEEEEQLHRKSPHSPPRPHNYGPERDFRAAQVAQDEEIARFMQRQEVKSRRRSRDPEGQGSRRERGGDSGDACERRVTRERKLQVPRERLDSEGLPSPSEETSPGHLPPSPPSEETSPGHLPPSAATAPQRQPIRNIAEELDPTFKARRRDSGPAPPLSSVLCQASPTPNRGFHDYTDEPLFIPPTKRHGDRSGRGKAKEKKEGCKQQ
ncbi:hypothetical protein AAFF_G00207240 [Aldrovandia affinis]|uniref:Coiled-coil domain-containing protein n=1 Tax=Aldrovandia affinis TaxID=143900 RepID=A0AAD7RH78_9TELE|nr:hypothetical protein AAFF_G00207240 [Aldrovandia affinis]